MTRIRATRGSGGDARLLADLALVGRLTEGCNVSARDRLEAELGVEKTRTLVTILSTRIRTARARVS